MSRLTASEKLFPGPAPTCLLLPLSFSHFLCSYFQPLLIRELRANIRSTLQENAQSLLLCPCTSSKILFGSYAPPSSGVSHAPTAATITSPVYAAAQVIAPLACAPQGVSRKTCSTRQYLRQRSHHSAQFSWSFAPVNMSGSSPDGRAIAASRSFNLL